MKVTVNLFNEEPVSYSLESSKIYVGRSSQCDVVVNHESMSRKHCLIEIDDGKIYITDLGSTNGVSIDGSKIAANEKTFYLNSLPLMIGAANISIDLIDHQTQVFNLSQSEIQKASTPTSSFKTQKIIKEKTASTQIAQKSNKKSAKKDAVTAPPKSKPNLKELVMAIISVLVFALMALWHFNQE